MSNLKLINVEHFSKEALGHINRAFDLLVNTNDKNVIDENIEVANILLRLKLSDEIVIGALLKNVEYDKEQFNSVINDIVYHANSLNDFKVTNTIDNDYEDYRNMLVILAHDYRVLLIELAERLYLMRLNRDVELENKKIFANETLNIYAPLAHRLGIGEIKEELEELSLFYLDKSEFENIENKLALKKSERSNLVDKMINQIDDLLVDHISEKKIFGRSKSIYSIYKKTNDKDKTFDDLFDLQAIRIICNSVTECYTILGLIHNVYPPIPGRFKDYIAIKKPNLYQSLHTSVVGVDHKVFEIQIRTYEMDQIAECGIAAHWIYKENGNTNMFDVEEQLHLFRSVIKDIDSKDHENIEQMQESIFESSIYCFTPNGKIITLPKDASVIDFAYRIHSKVAEEMVGAQVNGRQVPYETTLDNGDIVEIKTRKGSKSPNSEWLKYTKTSNANKKIKAYLKKKVELFREEEIDKGIEITANALKKKELLHDLNDESIRNRVMKHFGLQRKSDLYIAIANKRISFRDINELFMPNEEKLKIKLQTTSTGTQDKVYIKGAEDIKKELANCCNPIYGDRIIGVIVSGVGIKIHRLSCKNINEKSKLIDAEWLEIDKPTAKYQVDINIFSQDREVLLNDFIVIFGKLNVGIQKITSNVVGDYVKTSATILVTDADHLNRLIDNISKVKSVVNIDRVMK
jgi:guanosine-3',5'-bis(diphosphate) 3'-pyrophosphohydrolase